MLKFNINHQLFMQNDFPQKNWSDARLSDFLEHQRNQHKLMPREFKPVGENLKHVVKKIKITSKTKTHHIDAVWQSIIEEINPSLARNTEILSFRSGVLKIAIKSSTMFFEIQHFQKDIFLQKIREQSKYPVLEIVFKLEKS